MFARRLSFATLPVDPFLGAVSTGNQTMPGGESQPYALGNRRCASFDLRVSDKIEMMRRAPLLILAVSTAMVVSLVVAIRSGAMPLGVRGEWEWLRLPVAPAAIDVILAALGVAAYALFVGIVMKALMTRPTALIEAFAVIALLAASVVVQAVAHSGAPSGYGLAKWVVALYQKGSSGYFTVAKSEVREPWEFFADYPVWIKKQDALHLGTHPPGLIVTESILLRALERSPRSVRFILDHVPESVALAFRVFGEDNPMSPADRATLALTGFLTWLACAATVVPLYLLARMSLPPHSAWSAAALWPLVPAAILFQPAADTAFPLVSTSVLALAAAVGQVRPVGRVLAAVLTGTLLGIGMQFSLVFLPVGLTVALVIVFDQGRSRRDKLVLISLTGLGFLGVTACVWVVTKANPFVIWWWNQRNHARFYQEYPRTYLAWVVANPIELAVALGLPSAVWACLGAVWPRDLPRVSVATAAVLAFLTLGGRSLSEVGRLWLPFMPALLVASGFAVQRLGAGPKAVAATVALVGGQTLALEAMIQVVYPI
jgi:methylthioxylose transferase